MKKTKIFSFLLSREQASALKLKDQAYIILLPKKLANTVGVTDAPVFDIIIEKQKLSLVTAIPAKQETDQEVYNEKE